MALEFVQVKEEPLWEGQTPPSQCTVHVVNQELTVELEVVQDADLKKKVEMDSRCRTTVEQFTALLEFMEEHGDLGRAGPGGAGRLRGNRLWKQLDQRLSKLAGNPRKWKKVWADWKAKTKRKALEIRARGDLPGPPRPPGPRASLAGRNALAPLEQRLLAVMAAAGLPTRPAEAPEEPLPAPPPPPPALNPPPPAPVPSPPPAPLESISDIEGPPPPKPPRTPRPSRAGFTRHKRTRKRHTHLATRRRLRLEEERERNLHERETEKLRLQAQRIEVDCERNIQLKRLADVAQSFMDKFGGLVGGRGVNSEDGVS